MFGKILENSLGCLAAAAIALAAAPETSHAEAQGQAVQFDIPAQPLDRALKAFARKAQVQLAIDPQAVRGKSAEQLRGRYTPGEALASLLRGSGLVAEITRSGLILVKRGTRAPVAPAVASSQRVPAGARSSDPAPEQQSASGEEIVVTARARGESLMQVPVSVTVMTTADIERYGTTDLVKLAGVRPDIEIYTGGDTGGAFVLRGIGTTADTAGVESSVSVAMDGVQTMRPAIAYAGLFDLSQLEIMKGPQALFFGKNASAGVISIKSALPGQELSGYVRIGYEFEAHERYAEAAISIPLNDRLRTRFAGRYSKLRGWIKNIAEDIPDWTNPAVILPAPHSKYNDAETIAGRVTMMWEPASSYAAIFRATFAGAQGSANTVAEALCPSGQAISLGVFIEPNVDCKLNGVTAMNDQNPIYSTVPEGYGFDDRYNNGRDQLKATSMLLVLEQNLDLGKIAVQSITGHAKLKFAARGNASYSQTSYFNGGTNEDFFAWSEEVRLNSDFTGPLNFTLGGFWEHTRLKAGATLFLFDLGPDNLCPVSQPTCTPTGKHLNAVKESDYKQKTWSLFGQARYKPTPELELAAGARYTKVKKRAVQGQPKYVHYALDGFLVGEGVLLDDSLTEDNWSPEATVTWTPNSDHSAYVAFKTGYKTGGIAQPALVTPENVGNLVFDPEKVAGGEIGYKGYLLNRRLRLTATAFYYKFKGLQLTSFDPIIAAYRIQNAADVKQKGVEVDATLRVSEALSLRASAAYLSVKYGKFDNASCFANQTAADGCMFSDEYDAFVQDFTGRQLHRAPKFVAGAGVTYDVRIKSGGSLRLGVTADVRYRSGTYTGETQNPAGYQGKNALLHASARIYNEEAGWELAVIGRNLTNKRLIGFTSDRPGAETPGNYEVSAYTVRPREIAIQGAIKF